MSASITPDANSLYSAQHILGGNQGNQYSGIPCSTISLNPRRVIMEEKPNKVNTFWAANSFQAACCSFASEMGKNE
jgi:hypothetical protein